MKNSPIDTALHYAINDAKIYLHRVPKLTPTIIQSRIVESIHRVFVEKEIPLTQFELVQLNANSYTVTVNKTAFATIQLGKEDQS